MNKNSNKIQGTLDELSQVGHVVGPDGSSMTTRKYYSADTILEHDRNSMYPTEYLNKLNLSGIPPYCIELFVGCPIMLLKNMAGGLANGTRLIVTKIMARIIEAKVTTGPSKDKIVLDLGCGTGSNYRYLTKRIKSKQNWLMTDISLESINHFKKNLKVKAATNIISFKKINVINITKTLTL